MTSARYPKDYVVCRRCRRPLDRQEVYRGTETTVVWTHPAHRRETHAPEPVLAAATGGEVVGVCDFCSVSGPRWVIPCRSFAFGGRGFAGDWAACTSCKDLFAAGDVEGLIRRATPVGRTLPTAARRALSALFHQVQRHRAGDPDPLW